jgi:hypothetical protein
MVEDTSCERVTQDHRSSGSRARTVLVLVATVAAGAAAVWGVSGVPDARAASIRLSAPPAPTTTTAPAPVATTTPPAVPTTTTAPVPVATATPPAVPTTTTSVPTSVPAPEPAPATTADVAALVVQAEASGIAPGPNWSWTLGDTARCGVIPGGDNVGTGCTSGAAGSVTTVFAGSPGLALVAHELANAETENYAVPALVDLVVREGGSASWSPIDAVASCLVVHFLGFQDGAAGPWACPAALADVVAGGIHNAAFTG